MIFNAGNQDFLSLTDKVVLDSADVDEVLGVFIVLGVDGHLLGTDCKPLRVFIFILNI